jgi:hypothetical protein
VKISRGIRAEEIRRRRQPVLVQGIASADAALWLAISTAVESLSWDEVELNEVGVERSRLTVVTVKNNHVILPAQLIGQFTMTPDEFLGKCQQLAQDRHCRLFRGRDGSIAFQLRQPRSKVISNV